MRSRPADGGVEQESLTPFVRFTKTLYDDVLAGQFGRNELKVVLAVVRFTVGHNGQGEGAYLSRRKIADATHLHERTVRGVLDGLEREGVVRCLELARGKRAAKIALESDSRRWGRHAPGAPARRRAVNPDNLAAHRFDVDPLSARLLPHNAESLCGSQLAPSAGVSSRTDCGSQLADSEELKISSEEGEDDAADAGASSSSPEYFDLPGYGRVYRHDTWAFDAPDSRTLYLATFGRPPREAGRV